MNLRVIKEKVCFKDISVVRVEGNYNDYNPEDNVTINGRNAFVLKVIKLDGFQFVDLEVRYL